MSAINWMGLFQRGCGCGLFRNVFIFLSRTVECWKSCQATDFYVNLEMSHMFEPSTTFSLASSSFIMNHMFQTAPGEGSNMWEMCQDEPDWLTCRGIGFASVSRFTLVIQYFRLSPQCLNAGFPKFSVSEIHVCLHDCVLYFIVLNAICFFQFNDAILKKVFLTRVFLVASRCLQRVKVLSY